MAVNCTVLFIDFYVCSDSDLSTSLAVLGLFILLVTTVTNCVILLIVCKIYTGDFCGEGRTITGRGMGHCCHGLSHLRGVYGGRGGRR